MLHGGAPTAQGTTESFQEYHLSSRLVDEVKGQNLWALLRFGIWDADPFTSTSLFAFLRAYQRLRVVVWSPLCLASCFQAGSDGFLEVFVQCEHHQLGHCHALQSQARHGHLGEGVAFPRRRAREGTGRSVLFGDPNR